MTKITKTTILTNQEKQAIFDACTAGKSEGFKTRFAAVFFDPRTFAMVDEKTGYTVDGADDLLRIISNDESSPFALTESIVQAIAQYKIDTSGIYCKGAPMKAIKRFNQFMNAVICSNWAQFDKTSAIILLALDYANGKPLQNDALLYLGTGAQKNEGMSADTRGVARSVIREKLSQIDKGTMPTQISRSVGKSGFLSMCGAVHVTGKGKQAAYTINRDSLLVQKVLEMLGRATTGQIETMFAD